MASAQTVERLASTERDLNTELVPQSDARAAFASINLERLGRVPCFVGTRIPIKYLWEYLVKGKTLGEFLDDFGGLPRQEAVAALKQSYDHLWEGLPQP